MPPPPNYRVCYVTIKQRGFFKQRQDGHVGNKYTPNTAAANDILFANVPSNMAAMTSSANQQCLAVTPRSTFIYILLYINYSCKTGLYRMVIYFISYFSSHIFRSVWPYRITFHSGIIYTLMENHDTTSFCFSSYGRYKSKLLQYFLAAVT